MCVATCLFVKTSRAAGWGLVCSAEIRIFPFMCQMIIYRFEAERIEVGVHLLIISLVAGLG